VELEVQSPAVMMQKGTKDMIHLILNTGTPPSQLKEMRTMSSPLLTGLKGESSGAQVQAGRNFGDGSAPSGLLASSYYDAVGILC